MLTALRWLLKLTTTVCAVGKHKLATKSVESPLRGVLLHSSSGEKKKLVPKKEAASALDVPSIESNAPKERDGTLQPSTANLLLDHLLNSRAAETLSILAVWTLESFQAGCFDFPFPDGSWACQYYLPTKWLSAPGPAKSIIRGCSTNIKCLKYLSRQGGEKDHKKNRVTICLWVGFPIPISTRL